MSAMESEIKENLHAAMRARKVADLRYRDALIEAKQQGYSNSEIARTVGLSEAAIRFYLARVAKSGMTQVLITSGVTSQAS